MKIKTVINSLSKILLILGVSLLVPICWSMFNGGEDLSSFMLTFTIVMIIGGIISSTVKADGPISTRDGFMIVSLSWIVMSVFGSLPYVFSGVFPTYADAFFETMSGFTTTGSTVLTDIEALSGELLLWRSFTQWLGGLGFVVLFVALLSQMDTGGFLMFSAESSLPTKDKLFPRIQDTAKMLWITYLALTGILFVLLLLGGMNLLDALCHTFSTMATGGYSSKNASIAHFNSAYIEWVITIFMFLAATNFSLFYKSIVKRRNEFIRNDEFKLYISVVCIAILLVTMDLFSSGESGILHVLRLASFQVVSLVTTTGFVTSNYELWPTFAVVILTSLMLIGGCTSSTSGSIKSIRYLIAFRNIRSGFYSMLHPRAVIITKYNGKVVNDNVLLSTLQYFMVFFILIIIGSAMMAAFGMPFTESLSSAITATTNTGPALGSVGPVSNFAMIPYECKWIMPILMMLGRLELFTVLVLFVPVFWKY